MDGVFYFDVGEVGFDDIVYDILDVGDGVFVGDVNFELVMDEGVGVFVVEEVFGFDVFFEGVVDVLEFDVDGVFGVGLFVRGEVGDGLGVLDGGVVFFEVGDESMFD